MKRILLLFLVLLPIRCYSLTESIVSIDNASIMEIQGYVDNGYLLYEQLTNIYLERIEKYNGKYNAIITINEHALDEAKKLDKEFKKSGRRSLIHGIPILVKDNIDVVGMPTTAGAKGLLDSYPYKNASIIQKLVDAGAIILGKTNMDEFAFNASYSHSSFGYVYNAYNTNYSSYGSSGGTAVGVAANLAVAGIGTDTGSSIRIPSAANNLVGLRPTYDIMSNDGIIKFESLRDVAGPITKYVLDNAILLEIMDNTDKKYLDNVNIDNLNGIRIGVFKGVLNSSSSFIKNLMQIQIDNLKKLGAEIIYVDNFYPTYMFDATTFCSDFNEYISGTNSSIKSLNDLIKNGNYTQYIASYNNYWCDNDYRSTSYYKDYVSVRNNNIKFANNKFDSYNVDVIVYPTLQTRLFKMSEIYSSNLKTFSSNIAPLVGFPSMNVPIGFSDGLPYGMEILARANDEDIIYKIAYQLEKQNNFYKLPSIASSLYEISPDVYKLLDYYNEEKKEREYAVIKSKIHDFIINYNNYEDKEAEITNLIFEYDNTINVINDNLRKKQRLIRLVTLFSFVLFILLISIIIWLDRSKKCEKVK